VSEEIVGEALQGRRDDVVLATKFFMPMSEDPNSRGGSRRWIVREVENSLRRLGTDHIDLYQVHWPDPAVPAAETAGALRDLIAEGKIRHAGVSNYNSAQMAEFSATLPVETLQPPYHLFRREIEDGVLPYCREHNIGVLVYGPLAHGLLTGTMSVHTALADDDWRATSAVFRGGTYRRNLAAVRALEKMAADRGITVSQLAIAWTLANPDVHVAIVGARQVGHIEDSLRAVETALTDADLDEIDVIMDDATSVTGPSPEGMP
jgi:aryl-alcohol dehydrogenase-like predicted oxidoreductase